MASTVLVTGGNGFYGSHLCRRLRAAGKRVVITTRDTSAAGGDDVQVGDFSNLEDARRILAAVKPDIVYHLAGSATARPDPKLVLQTHHSQVTSALNLITEALESDIGRIVLVGSLMEMTGRIEDEVPSSPYSAAKTSLMHYGRMFHRHFGAPVVVARPFMTFGPGQAESHVLPYVIRSLAAGIAPKLSSGSWQTDWIFVDDVVDGLVVLGEHEGIEGYAVDLGRGELNTVRDMVDRIVKIMQPKVEPEYGALEDRPDEPVRVADAAASFDLTGWESHTGLDDGLSQTIEWYVAER